MRRRLRLIPIAAGTALLAMTLLGSPAAAADGEVVLASSSSYPQTVEDPAAGECVAVAEFSGSSVDNLTDAAVELHGTGDCSGDALAVLEPEESRQLSLSTEVAAIRARS